MSLRNVSVSHSWQRNLKRNITGDATRKVNDSNATYCVREKMRFVITATGSCRDFSKVGN